MISGWRQKLTIAAVACGLASPAGLPAAEDAPSAYKILEQNCFACHGAAKTSGLDLRTAETALAGGARGAVIVPNEPSDSRLYQVVTHEAEPAMPPGKKLSEEDI